LRAARAGSESPRGEAQRFCIQWEWGSNSGRALLLWVARGEEGFRLGAGTLRVARSKGGE